MIRKLIVLSIVAAMLSPEVGARPVSRVEAEKVARGFFQGRNGGNTKLKAQRLPQSIIGETKGEVEPFYVFNNDSQRGGFVIVAGDDAFASVIGYSDTGRFDLDGAPSGLTELMKIYSRYVTSASSSTAETTLPVPGVPKMEPLLGDIKWGQDYPFNTLCPTYVTGGVTKRYYTGCVATAATQVMRYYKYPERGTGSKTHVVDGNPITVDFGGTSYDWANMPAVASDSPSTNEVTALSRLAADFGIAVEMNYMAGGSGAYTMMVPGALRDYFGYDKAVRMHSRGYYTTSEWMGMIKAELDEGHPVYYAASSEDGLGGHAFVCDGYDSNDYVHINWGWYGRSDGYFLINRLNPGELGEGGGSGAYNISQEILTGFIPAGTADVEDVMSLYGSSRFTCTDYGTDMTLMAFIENLDTRDFNGVVGAVLVKDGGVVGVLKEESLSIAGFKNGKSSASAVTLRNVPKSVTAVADGDYRLNFGFKVQGGDKWSVVRHPIGMPGYADVSVKDGRITVNDMHKPAPDVVLLEKIAVDGDLYVGGCGVFTLNIENRSDDVRLSKVAVKLTSVSDPDVQAVATSSVNVYDESRATLELLISLDGTLAAGEYEVGLRPVLSRCAL